MPKTKNRSRENLDTFLGREAIILRHADWLRAVKAAIADLDDDVMECDAINRAACSMSAENAETYAKARVHRLDGAARIARDNLSKLVFDDNGNEDPS